MRLFCFGLGYSAKRFVALHGARFEAIAGTVRNAERAAALSRDGFGGHPVAALAFDGTKATPGIAEALTTADVVLASAPPGANGDPALAQFAAAIAASRISTVVYLSTIGVYGDSGGAWVDEATPARPDSARSRARLAAEQAWAALSAPNRNVAILRLPGIYGPGRNALHDIAAGRARRIVKPGHVFNRAHVDDIAAAIMAVIDRRYDGIVNVADDEPAPSADPVAFAATLMGRTAPPEIPFAIASRDMSPMALSFWAAHRRVSNARLKAELGVTLTFPTYREGLTALHLAGEGLAGEGLAGEGLAGEGLAGEGGAGAT